MSLSHPVLSALRLVWLVPAAAIAVGLALGLDALVALSIGLATGLSLSGSI